MTYTTGLVPPPPLTLPLVGLIPSLGAPGGPYLDPDDTLDSYGLPPFNPERPSEIPVGDGASRRPAPTPPQRWEGGIRYQPYQGCGSGAAADPCSPDLTTITANPDTVEAVASLIWAGDKCSTFGWAEHNFTDRATMALLSSESKQIAAELWSGTRAQAAGWPNHYLAHNAWADVLSNGALDPASALDCLEQGLASCSNGQRGAIHCTRQFGSFLSGLGNTFRTVNGVILTYAGTVIIPDAGYDGSGPDGQAATSGHQWAYATLMPTVRRSPIQLIPETFEEAVIRGTNLIEWRAIRQAVASFDPCCHLAVEVNLPLCLTGGVS